LSRTENTAIAQFLHDNVSSSLVVIKMRILKIREQARSPEQRRELNTVSALLDELINSIRQASRGTRAADMQKASLYEAIGTTLQTFEESTSVRTLLEVKGDDAGIPNSVSATTLSIVREALTNIVRHAHAKEVRVSLVRQRQNLSISIRDDGDGTPRTVQDCRVGFGLYSMRQRAYSCGGTIHFRSRPRRGFEVVVRIPLSVSVLPIRRRSAS
ncbi:MAG TPA: ATP-binding protein, partial [Terriglobia bacterium]|nr:ATP-binding protein [Terriglobia bacterium]